ncbi:S1 family peptidase [Paenibacillus sp. YIM B09110]|uniref:S1 family peptidase n=1 Tax=Paenibacillus sp. YIM B09110 TaxID=3126102 RepID=UPI00301BDDF3
MRRIAGVILLSVLMLVAVLNRSTVSMAETPERYDAESIYASANEAVFYVRAFRDDGALMNVGSGFLTGPEGTALTAYHVVDGASRLNCVLKDGTAVDCRITVQDEMADTAVLELPSRTGGAYSYLRLRTSPLKAGEKVFAIGYPMKGTNIITEGIVNAPVAPINGRNRILISAELVSGMSGGPLLDEFGYAAGLLSGSLRTMNGIHLAVDSADIKRVMEQVNP